MRELLLPSRRFRNTDSHALSSAEHGVGWKLFTIFATLAVIFTAWVPAATPKAFAADTASSSDRMFTINVSGEATSNGIITYTYTVTNTSSTYLYYVYGTDTAAFTDTACSPVGTPTAADGWTVATSNMIYLG